MGTITLTWNDTNTTETGHKVYRSLSPMTVGSLPVAIATLGANVTSYTDSDVVEGQTYYYRVAAVRNASEAVSAEIAVQAVAANLLVAPSGLVLELITGHKYWRALITKSRSSVTYFAMLAELEFRDVSGGVNLASGGVSTASSSLSGYAPGMAFDTDPLSHWLSEADATLPQWIAYEFTSSVQISEVMLQAGDTAPRAERAPEDFAIEFSDDGVTWTQKASFVAEPAWAISEVRTYTI